MSERTGSFLQRWLIITIAVWVADLFIAGIRYDTASSLLLAALILGLLNAFVRPLLILVSLPLLLLTLGVGLLIINALLLMLVSYLVPGFQVDSFGTALLGALVIGAVSMLANFLFSGPSKAQREKTQIAQRDDDDGPIIDV